MNQREMGLVLDEIMSGSASDKDMSLFLLALNAKGPTIEEITSAVQVMRRFAIPVKTDLSLVLDTCGTGGDQKNTFNISTLVALVVAGAGVTVAKHGNRAVSSSCGSADLLEALGVNINLDEEQLGRCLKKVGIAFLFAQKLHPAMKNVAAVRKSLGVKTIFNILGPLANPAKATHQMMGVYSRELVEPLAHVLRNLGLERALVVHGHDGLDEITTADMSFAAHWNGKSVETFEVDPRKFGFPLAMPQDLIGADPEANVRIANDILNGRPGPKRDIVLFNAAWALHMTGKAKDVSQGVTLAAESIDSGRAVSKLEALKKFSNS